MTVADLIVMQHFLNNKAIGASVSLTDAPIAHSAESGYDKAAFNVKSLLFQFKLLADLDRIGIL